MTKTCALGRSRRCIDPHDPPGPAQPRAARGVAPAAGSPPASPRRGTASSSIARTGRGSPTWTATSSSTSPAASAALNAGHAAPRVAEPRCARSSRSSQHACFMVAPYEPYVALAATLCAIAPDRGRTEEAALFNSGCRGGRERRQDRAPRHRAPAVLAFDPGFHGRTLLALDAHQQDARRIATASAHSPRGLSLPAARSRCAGRAAPASPDACGARHRRPASLPGQHVNIAPTSIARRDLEPVLGEGGFIVPPREFVREALGACAASTASCSSPTRCRAASGAPGRMFACERTGIVARPRLHGEVARERLPARRRSSARAALMDAVQPGGLGGTFGGNPVACAAGAGRRSRRSKPTASCARAGDSGRRRRSGASPLSTSASRSSARRAASAPCARSSWSTDRDALAARQGAHRARPRQRRAPRPAAALGRPARQRHPHPDAARDQRRGARRSARGPRSRAWRMPHEHADAAASSSSAAPAPWAASRPATWRAPARGRIAVVIAGSHPPLPRTAGVEMVVRRTSPIPGASGTASLDGRLRRHRVAALPLQPRSDGRRARRRRPLRRPGRPLPRDARAAEARAGLRARAACMAILGMGSAPGILNVLAVRAARDLETVTEVHCMVGAVDRTRWREACRRSASVTRPTRCSTSSRCHRPCSAMARSPWCPPLDPRRADRQSRFPAPVGRIQRRHARSTPRWRRCRSTSPTAAIREVTFRQGFERHVHGAADLPGAAGARGHRPVGRAARSRGGTRRPRRTCCSRLLDRLPQAVPTRTSRQRYEVLRTRGRGGGAAGRDRDARIAIAGPRAGGGIGPDIDTGAPPSIAVQLMIGGEIALRARRVGARAGRAARAVRARARAPRHARRERSTGPRRGRPAS